MGFWSKIGHALKFAAPIASMFIPGMQGFGAAALLGRAGIGAATGAAGGGGWKGALLGGGLGAGAGALGRAAGNSGSIWSKMGGNAASMLGGYKGTPGFGDGYEKMGGGSNPYGNSDWYVPGAIDGFEGAGATGGNGGGWLSKFGKLAKGISASDLFKTGTSIAGGVAKGMASGRKDQIENTLGRDRIQSNAYHQAMLSALGKNVQDFSVERPDGVPTVHISGGLRPSALGLEGRAAAAKNYDLSMDSLGHLPSVKAGTVENILGTAGAIGAGANQTAQANQTNSLVQQLLAKQQADAEAAAAGN